MAKSHRDNHKARVKRGPGAFALKVKRRKQQAKIKKLSQESFDKLMLEIVEKAAIAVDKHRRESRITAEDLAIIVT